MPAARSSSIIPLDCAAGACEAAGRRPMQRRRGAEGCAGAVGAVAGRRRRLHALAPCGRAWVGAVGAGVMGAGVRRAATATLAVALALLASGSGAHAAHWAHSTELDPNFSVFWSPNEEDITFELQVRTLGYVGFGFSADGSMKDADMVVGWVYKDKVFMQDRHAQGHSEPELDATSNYELLLGYENGTHTVLRFRRRYYTCDPDDFPITNDTMRLLYAYHSNEPRSESEPLPYHGSTQRGARSLFLLQRSGPRQPTHDLSTWDLRNPPVSLSAGDDTLFWCRIFKVPNLKKKHHMIRYEPLQESGSGRYVHHVIVYECGGLEENPEMEEHAREVGQPCYQPNLPEIYFSCNSVVVAWAQGSDGFSFPPETGYPLDPENEVRYFMMETRYVNPGVDTDLTDGAGIRLYHTASLRRYDAGVLSVGIDPNWRHIIPPNQSEVVSQGHCISQCTRASLPRDGVNVFATLLHTHLIGRKVKLRHIRDGQELSPIAADNNYDYNYQVYRRLQKPVKVYQGDYLMTECVYNSQGRGTITLGGLTTREEMCLAYALYYPRTDLVLCHSLPSLPTVLHSLGIQELWQGSTPVMIKSPPELADMTLENRLITYNWEQNFHMFEETTRRGSFQPRCWLKQMDTLPGTDNLEAFYPNVSRPLKEASACPSGRLKKPRRRKKPGNADDDLSDGEDFADGDGGSDGGARNVLGASGGGGAGGGAGADAASAGADSANGADKTKVYSSSIGVQESSRLNGAAGRYPLPSFAAAVAAAAVAFAAAALPRAR